jgi:hypothetical protein
MLSFSFARTKRDIGLIGTRSFERGQTRRKFDALSFCQVAITPNITTYFSMSGKKQNNV